MAMSEPLSALALVLDSGAVAAWLHVDVAWVEQAIADDGLPILGRGSDGVAVMAAAEVRAWLRRPTLADDES
jgi:hypothetical protein